MKSDRFVLVLAAAVVCVVVLLPHLKTPRAQQIPTGGWLQLIAGPAVGSKTNSLGDQERTIIFLVSNAGPESVTFHVKFIRWEAMESDAQGSWDGLLPDRGHLQPGATACLATRAPETPPPVAEIEATWSINWVQAPTMLHKLLDQLEDRLPFGLPHRRNMAWGTLEGIHNLKDRDQAYYERLMLRRYGVRPNETVEATQPRSEDSNDH